MIGDIDGEGSSTSKEDKRSEWIKMMMR